MGKNQHVTPSGDKWRVTGAGNSKATKICDTQKEAINCCTRDCQKSKK